MTELFRIFRDGIAAVLALISQHEYLALFGIVATEEAGIPLPAPSDIVIMFYGNRGRHDLGSLALVVLTCTVASTFGTLIPYLVTRKYGDAAANKLAQLMDIEPKQVAEWERRIARRGFVAIFIGRLIPGLRVAMSLIGGTAKVPLLEFSGGVFAAALIYWTFWTGIGALFGPTVDRLIPRPYITYVVIGIPVVFVGYLVFRYVRGRRRRAHASAAH
jgi:membrane protein DedA with SNARE-associated domain